jgi:uncharacterized membrane protein SirB2
MSTLSWYPTLKAAHVALVVASGALFAARGAGVWARQRWPLGSFWRWLSVAIDTLLLGAGVLLWWTLSLNPLVQTWLGAKLLLLVAYIVLGSLAIRRARTPAQRGLSYVAALATYLFMASVALRHDPLGVLGLFGAWSVAAG